MFQDGIRPSAEDVRVGREERPVERRGEGDLTSFQAVPRVIGVRVVVAEHDADGLHGASGGLLALVPVREQGGRRALLARSGAAERPGP